VMSDDPIEAAPQVEWLLQGIADAGFAFNNVALTIAIKAFAKNDAYRDKAVSLLKYMEGQHSMSGDKSMKPLPEAYECLGIKRSD
jgi:hypothetical protein